MSINVKLVYARDKSSTKIGSVPLTCPISKIKDILKQINKMNSTKTIRVVYRGAILQDEVLIGELVSNEQKEITLFIIGITTLQSKSQPQNQVKENIKTKFGKSDKKTKKKKRSYLLLLSLLAFILLFSYAIIKIIYFDPSEYGLPDEGIQLKCSKKSVLYGILFFDFVIVVIILLLTSYINFATIFRYIYLFFISLLPIFNYDEFKREKEIQPN